MRSGQRWVTAAFLAELPLRLGDFAELPLWRIDRVATLARQVQHELRDNGDDESALMYNLAVAAETMCWHPREREAVEQYVRARGATGAAP